MKIRRKKYTHKKLMEARGKYVLATFAGRTFVAKMIREFKSEYQYKVYCYDINDFLYKEEILHIFDKL